MTTGIDARLSRLQPLVGLAVTHRLWGAGTIVAVRGTSAPQFVGRIVVVVDFASGTSRGTPFTVADLWGGGRFVRPPLPAPLAGVGAFLDTLLTAAEPAPVLPPRTFAAPVARRVPTTPSGDVRPATWARDLFRRDDWVLLDTETTGLDGDAEIIDLALLDRDGTVLLDTLLRPQRPIPPVVSRVHGLYDHHVRTAPTFPAIWPQLRALLDGRTLIAYNVAFDARLLQQTAARHGIPLAVTAQECAMRRYAAWRAANRLAAGRAGLSLERACQAHGIAVGGHRAAADCRATLALLRVMAGSS